MDTRSDDQQHQSFERDEDVSYCGLCHLPFEYLLDWEEHMDTLHPVSYGVLKQL